MWSIPLARFEHHEKKAQHRSYSPARETFIDAIGERSAPGLSIMSSSFPQFSPARLRSYVFRLPLVTRVVLLVIVGFWILGFQTVWDVATWGALAPKEVGFGSSESAGVAHHFCTPFVV
jgi:hypothetical protein